MIPSALTLMLTLLSLVVEAPAAEPPAAVAASPTRGSVVVLRPADVDDVTRTALARVTGELTAARFHVTVFPLDPNTNPTSQVDTVALESNPVAAIAIAHITETHGDTIAIWVSDRLGRRTTIQRMALSGNNVSQDAELLAVEAIELIRVSIAGLRPAPSRPATADVAPASPPPAVRTDRSPRVRVGLGVAMLQDRGLSSTQWMGSLSALLTWRVGLAAFARVSGLGTGITIAGDAGTATVHTQVATVGAAWIFWNEERVQSLVKVGVGVERFNAAGAAPEASRMHTAEAWSSLGTLGVGAAARLGGPLSLTVDVDAIVTTSRLVLRVADTETRSLSRPGILVNVGVQANF